ncbi:MAG: hypothetical protein K6F45_02695 [Saccharofermentans sp.]|nr:hypothetical protein [Saccharofermentans sp.]
MKHTVIRKAGAAALAGSMALSFASCALFGANKKEIVEAADTFASTLLKQDAGKIIKLTNEDEDSDSAAALEIIFDESMYSDDQNEFNKAVADTISYEVDEDSVEVDKEEASVDVTFTMVDYEKALKDDYSDIDEVVDLIKDCEDTKDVKVTFEFEKDDDEWILSNLDDKGFGKLFDYMTYELDLTPDLASIIDTTSCWSSSYAILSEVYFTETITDYDIVFDVYCDGALIATDQPATYYDTYIYCDYYEPDYNDLPAGDYSIVVKCGGAEITTMETTVEEYSEPQPTDDGLEDLVDYTYVYDGQGELGDILVAVDWYLDDGNNNYTVNMGGIEYDMYFTDDLTYDDVVGITFNIYDEDGETVAEGLTVYGSNISYGTNESGYYYVYLSFGSEDGLDAGTYYIEVFNPDGSTLYTDYCTVPD